MVLVKYIISKFTQNISCTYSKTKNVKLDIYELNLDNTIINRVNVSNFLGYQKTLIDMIT